MHILRYQEWQSPTGRWYCNDVSDLGGISGKWWVPARMLNISLTDYVTFLKDEYNAIIDTYNIETDILIYHFDSYTDAHKFVLYINRIARNKQFLV